MSRINVGIDVDGVLRDFDAQFLKYAKEVKDINIATADYGTWGFPNVVDEQGRKLITAVFADPRVGEFVYQNAPTIQNAYTGYRLFTDNSRIQTFIVSSQKKGYELFTDNWLMNNDFTKHINVFYESNKLKAPVNVLIDDKPDNVIRFNQNKRFSILMNRDHNSNADIPEDIPRVNDMIEAYAVVKKRFL